MTKLYKPRHPEMKQHGVLLSAPMIYAYKSGIKNQTRRVKGLALINENPDRWEFKGIHDGVANFCNNLNVKVSLPYGQEGETLYFKETWMAWEDQVTGQDFLKYRADNTILNPVEIGWNPSKPDDWNYLVGKFDKWQPSMFMPRKCARFFNIPITRVRVERLQDITEDDARNEGAVHITPSAIGHPFSPITVTGYRAGYKNLWNTINDKKLPWHRNPWVFVYEFPFYQKG